MEITLEQLDELSIENEKKNQLIRDQEQRIRELEDCLKASFSAIGQAKSETDAGWRGFAKTESRCAEAVRMYKNRVEQLLNQKL